MDPISARKGALLGSGQQDISLPEWDEDADCLSYDWLPSGAFSLSLVLTPAGDGNSVTPRVPLKSHLKSPPWESGARSDTEESFFLRVLDKAAKPYSFATDKQIRIARSIF